MIYLKKKELTKRGKLHFKCKHHNKGYDVYTLQTGNFQEYEVFKYGRNKYRLYTPLSFLLEKNGINYKKHYIENKSEVVDFGDGIYLIDLLLTGIKNKVNKKQFQQINKLLVDSGINHKVDIKF